jgi:hypothetical protein
MAKYISRGNVSVDAYVVTEQEGRLQVQLDGGGLEVLRAGDALISAGDGATSFVIRGRLFAALFEAEAQDDQEEPPSKRLRPIALKTPAEQAMLERLREGPAGPDADGTAADGANGPTGPEGEI